MYGKTPLVGGTFSVAVVVLLLKLVFCYSTAGQRRCCKGNVNGARVNSCPVTFIQYY